MLKRTGKAGSHKITATIVGLGGEGEAVAVEEGSGPSAGRKLFVFGAAPGERVQLRVTEEHPRFARAELLEVLKPSEARVTPPCPLFGRCGGCDWQHLPVALQRSAKRERLSQALRHEAAETVASPESYGYRAKIRLHFRREGNTVRLGYFARGSSTLIDVESCPLLQPALQETLRIVRVRLMRDLDGEGELRILQGEQAALELACQSSFTFGRLQKALERRKEALLSPQGPFASLRLRGPEDAQVQFGGFSVTHEGGRSAAGVFSQANPALNRLLQEHVVQLLGGKGKRILELYAGTGNFTLPLVESGAKVTAVESSREAVQWLRRNLQGRCEVIEGGAAERTMLLARSRKRDFDAVLLDPPRSGAKPTMEAVAALAPREIVYVSCDPASLARDLSMLTQYEIVAATPFDMFPQSAHLEAVVQLRKREIEAS